MIRCHILKAYGIFQSVRLFSVHPSPNKQPIICYEFEFEFFADCESIPMPKGSEHHAQANMRLMVKNQNYYSAVCATHRFFKPVLHQIVFLLLLLVHIFN